MISTKNSLLPTCTAIVLLTIGVKAAKCQSVNTTNKAQAANTTFTSSTSATSPTQNQTGQNTVLTQSTFTSTDSGPLFPATSHQQALFNARKEAGRSDPLAPITGFKPFPSHVIVPQKIIESKQKFDQPPVKYSDLLGKPMLPPPPPVSVQSDLPVSELPLPPDRPSILAKLKLTGIIGDKAIFAITDKEAIRVNKWPGVVMMAAGDRFESIQTLSVSADSAVLEEDGERATKTLERIR